MEKWLNSAEVDMSRQFDVAMLQTYFKYSIVFSEKVPRQAFLTFLDLIVMNPIDVEWLLDRLMSKKATLHKKFSPLLQDPDEHAFSD
jgi:hypothetical protein